MSLTDAVKRPRLDASTKTHYQCCDVTSKQRRSDSVINVFTVVSSTKPAAFPFVFTPLRRSLEGDDDDGDDDDDVGVGYDDDDDDDFSLMSPLCLFS